MKTALFKVALVLATLWFVVVSYMCLVGILFLEDDPDRLKSYIEIALTFDFVGLGPLLIILSLMKWKGIKLRESITSLHLNDKETSSTQENEKKKGVSRSA